MAYKPPEGDREALIAFITSGDMRARRIAHPEWTAKLQEMCKKMGVKETPLMFSVPTKFPNAFMIPSTGSLFLTEGFLNIAGNPKAMGAPTTKTLATIGHELAHFKFDQSGHVVKYLSPKLLPIACISALYLYDKTHEQKRDGEYINDAIARAVDGEKANILGLQAGHGVEEKATREWKDWAIDLGRYALAGALGVGGGLMIARHSSLAAEFRADKWATILAKDPEGDIQMLKDLAEVSKKCWKEEMKNFTPPKGFSETFQHERWKLEKRLDRYFYHAHPDDAARFAHIRKVGRELGLYDAKTMPSHSHVAALAQGVGAVSHTL